VVHPDGTLATLPLALVEVQAYAYAARMWMANLLELMGDHNRAAEVRAGAAILKERFNVDFWLAEEGFYAQAIEVGKGPVRKVTSNPGHALLCGILTPERAAQVAARLVAPDMLSSWWGAHAQCGRPELQSDELSQRQCLAPRQFSDHLESGA
jgi:glycogen debranching enzyme